MASRRLQIMLGIGLLALGAVEAQAFVSSDEARVFEVPLREAAPILAPERLAPAVEASADMAARYGGTWQVYMWNPLSDSPELMYGSGVDLAGAPLSTDRDAEAVATAFVGSNLYLLRAAAGDLVTDEVVRAAGKVAVHFQQRFHGIPVAGGRVLSVFTESGRLFVFGSTFYRDIHVNPVPAIGAAAAAGIARADLPFNPATDSVIGEPELLVLPVPGAEGWV